MKKIIIYLVLFSILVPLHLSFAQDCFTVLKIKGVIELGSSGQQLKKGEQVCTNDNVIFKSADAVAILYSSSKGRYTIRPNKTTEREITGIIKNLVADILSKSESSLDTRGSKRKLKSNFGDNFNVIGICEIYDEYEEYPLDSLSYFYISFTYNGKNYSKQLKSSGNSFIIDREVYTIDGQEIRHDEIDKVSLYYHNISDYLIKRFTLRFLDSELLSEEISAYIYELKEQGKDSKEIMDEIIQYMYDIYESFYYDNLRSWLIKNFNLIEETGN